MASYSLRGRYCPPKTGRAHSVMGNSFTDSLKKIGNATTGFVTRAVIDRIDPPKVSNQSSAGLPQVEVTDPNLKMPLIIGGVAGALLLVMLLSGGRHPASAAN